MSDLGTLVFSRGSETDSWFSGDLGQDCIQRRERSERRARRRSKKRTLEKKKSFRDLRGAHKPDLQTERSEEIVDKGEKGAAPTSRLSVNYGNSEVHSNAESSPTSDDMPRASRKSLSKDLDSPEFPYRKAFNVC